MANFSTPDAPLLRPVPLPDINDAGQALPQGTPWHFNVQIGAARNHGLLLSPRMTPLPLFFKEIQEWPNESKPVLGIHIDVQDIQDGQFVLDIPYSNETMEGGLIGDFTVGSLDPIVTGDDNAQEPGPVGFDIDALFDGFCDIFDVGEDGEAEGSDEPVIEENDRPKLRIDIHFFEREAPYDGDDDDDDMDLDEVDGML